MEKPVLKGAIRTNSIEEAEKLLKELKSIEVELEIAIHVSNKTKK